MLENLLGETIADAWHTLVTKRSFVAKGHSGIVYAVGQPMGALSSWAVFSLTHHLIVQVAAMDCGVIYRNKWFSGYVLIGDDIAIFHKDVAVSYKRILLKLGIPINLTKSSTPPPKGTGAVEIAKRTFYQGKEMSPCPPDIILQAKKDPLIFPMLIRLCQERDIANAHKGGPVASLMKLWYQPQDQTALELCLYDPRPTRALLKELTPNSSKDSGETENHYIHRNPWSEMLRSSVAMEAKLAIQQRVDDMLFEPDPNRITPVKAMSGAEMFVASVEMEVKMVLLQRIGDKALNLARRFEKGLKAAKKGTVTHNNTGESNSTEIVKTARLVKTPLEALTDQLLLVALT